MTLQFRSQILTIIPRSRYHELVLVTCLTADGAVELAATFEAATTCNNAAYRTNGVNMGEYFKSWRRKFGVATLILACLLAVVWVRSYFAMSVLYFPSKNRDNNVPLHNGALIWFSMEMPEEDFAEYMEVWDIWPPFAIVFAYPKRELSLKGFDRQSGSWGFEFYERRRRELVDTVWVIPFWPVVIPPTLLSAYLLLSKARAKPTVPRSNSANSSTDSPSHPGQNV